MTDYMYTPHPSSHKARRWVRWLLVIPLLVGLWFGGKTVGHLGNATITVVNRITGSHIGQDDTKPDLVKLVDDPEYAMPDKDDNRLDILIMGIRGEADVQDGGTLTDTILLFSMDKKTGTSTLTSIPRDLTVRVTDTKTEKINTAYIYNGLNGSKKYFSRVLGVSIDNIVVFDFDAFKYIVTTLGGVTITLDKPFEEAQQWGYAFSLPAGENTLDGDQALYYVRSRYGTSDFDRSRRQMQVIMAIKSKVAGLHLTQNPLKALELITTIRKHIQTDMNIFDLGTLKDLAEQGDQLGRIKRYQLTTENVLYETKVNGIYELLPRDNTLAHIKRFIQTVLTDSPVLPTASPTPAVSPSPTATAAH